MPTRSSPASQMRTSRERVASTDNWLSTLVTLIPKTVYNGESETVRTKEVTRADSGKQAKPIKKKKKSKKRSADKTKLGVTTGGIQKNEALRAKLGEKIAALRAQRKADEKKPEKKRKVKDISLKVKKAKEAQAREPRVPSKPEHMQIPSNVARMAKETSQMKTKSSTPKISFSNVVGFAEESKPRKKKQSVEMLLEKAERAKEKERKLTNLDAGLGKQMAELMRKKKAIQRAAGEKVKDDPALLKKTIKKKERQKKKSEKEWKKRTKDQKKQLSEKVKKREDNLKSRVDAKKAKQAKRRRR